MAITVDASLPQPRVIRVSVPGVPGASGKNVELSKNSTHIQWRVVGDSTWIDLVPLSEITGTGGSGSQDLSAYAKTVDVQNALNNKVNTTRTITPGAGLTGGGDLSANRTLAVNFGTTSGTVAQGNDSRLSDTRVPTDNSVTSAKIVDGTIVNADISNTAGIATSKISGLAAVATSGSYDDLINKPASSSGGTITDATTSAKGVVQLAGDLAGTASAPVIATGAVTSSKIADGTIVNSDISSSAAIAASKIAGLSTVATTGSYNDLTNKPTGSGSGGLGGTGVLVDPDDSNALILENGATATDSQIATAISTNNSASNTAVKNLIPTGTGGTIADGSITSAKIADGTIVNADISSSAAIAVSKISGISTVGKTGSYNDLTDKPTTSSTSGLTESQIVAAIAADGNAIRNALLSLFGNVNWQLDSDGIPYFTSIGAGSTGGTGGSGGTTTPPASGGTATVDNATVGSSTVGGTGSSGNSGTLNTVDHAVVGNSTVG